MPAPRPINPRELPALIVPILIGAAVLLGATMDPLPELGLFNTKRIAQLCVLPLVLSLGLADPAIRVALAGLLARVPAPLAWAGATVLALGLASAVRHLPSPYPLADVALLAVSVCAVPVVAACRVVAGTRFDRLAMAMLALLAAAVTLQEGLGFFASVSAGNPHSMEYMLIHFSHPRFYNQVQTWTLPVLAALPWVFGARRGAPWLAVVLLAGGWCILVLSGARGSFLAIALASIAVAALTWRSRPRWAALQGAGLALGVVLYLATLGVQDAGLGDSAAAESIERSAGRVLSGTSGRTKLWSLAWEQAGEHPWLGIGPSRFACISPPGLGSHPHNFALQMLGEWGWPATLLMAGAVLLLGRRLLARLADPPADYHGPDALGPALGCAVLAAALHAGLSGVLVMPLSQLTGVLIGGWLFGLLSGTEPLPRAPGRATWIFAGTALAAALALLLFGTGELRGRGDALAAGGPDEIASPRFWQVGALCETGDSR